MVMTKQRSVVVTGIGATTPLGGDAKSSWEAALAAQSGIDTFQADWMTDHEDLPVHFGGQPATPGVAGVPRPDQRRLEPNAQYALIAAREAWEDAGAPQVEPERLGATIASGIGGVWTLLSAWDTMKDRGARRVLPMTVPMLMPNSAAGWIGLEFGARAGAHTTVSACASGAESIGYALEMIRSGRADVVIAGGTEAPIHPLPIASFAAMHALSTRNDDPQGASRPYDVNRDGFVMGEGAGVVILESADHAQARGAKVYAEIAGVGITSDAHHIAAPEPEGREQTRAMDLAMADANISTADVVHVNAHATSTPVGDMIEAKAIAGLFGSDADHVRLSATKSMTGHLLGAAGAVESIFTILALQQRQAPPTINVTDPDPELSLDLVRDTARELPAGDIAAINNSFGFGGHNVALVIRSV